MNEAWNGMTSSGDQDEPKRSRVALRLTGEIDQLKREIERSRDMRNRTRILCEFERPSPSNYVEMKYINAPAVPTARRMIDEAMRAEMTLDYASDAKILALIDVLKQSRKIVFSSEWEIGYRESRIVNALDKVDRARRRNRLLYSSEEVWIDKSELGN